MRIKSVLFVLVLAVSVGLIAGIARASWSTSALTVQPRANLMSFKASTVNQQVPGGAGEIHWTLSAKGQCFGYMCLTSSNFFTSSSAAPTTAASNTGFILPAQTVLRQCMTTAEDYLSVYVAAGTTCVMGEINSVQ